MTSLKRLGYFGILVSVIFLSGCCTKLKVSSANFAKEYCSCHFVEGQTTEYCEKYAYNLLPIGKLKVDQINKWVEVSSYGHSTRVQWEGPRFGCRIQK